MIIKRPSEHDEWKAEQDKKHAEAEEERKRDEEKKNPDTPAAGTPPASARETNTKKWVQELYDSE